MEVNGFSNIFPTPRFLKFSYVGMDLSASSVKYAELFNDGRGLKLGRYGYKSFSPSESVFTSEEIKNELMELRAKKGIDYAKLTLPEEDTYLFVTEAEGSTKEEIREAVEFHLEENIPLAAADALFECYTLNQGSDTKKKKVLVSAVSRPVVQNYIDFLVSCGITPVSFMVESSSLSRSVIPTGDKSVQLLVYLAEKKTVLAVVKDEYVRFSSTIKSGSETLTSALQKYFKISYEEAKKIKNSSGLRSGPKDKELFDALTLAVSVLRDEIRKVFMYWDAHEGANPDSKISKVVLCGQDAAMPGFVDYLSMSLKTKVQIADVWVNLPRYKHAVPPIRFEESLEFGPCLGLSISSL